MKNVLPKVLAIVLLTVSVLLWLAAIYLMVQDDPGLPDRQEETQVDPASR
jgi:hypothetical protein